MERLTKRNSEGVAVLKIPYQCERCGEAIKRLANYGNGEPIEKLARLEDLQEQGRLLELPCAVGDTVYYRHSGIKIEPMRIEEITITECAILLTLEYSGNDEKLKYWRMRIDNTAFDNTVVFLTREEAEEALKRVEDGK